MASVSEGQLMKLRPACACCGKRVTRIILAETIWNGSGGYLFQCLGTGKITPIADIEFVIRTGMQEAQVSE